jgi:hypothetical protein
MTTMIAAAPPDRAPSLKPVPWRRMAWVTWRQHRLAFAGVAVLFSVAAAYLLVTGLQMRSAFAAVAACHPSGSTFCQAVAHNFLNTYAPGVGATLALLQILPALVGAFVGAPLLARELERGTYRYAWTQGFGRVRWTVAKLVLLASTVTIVGGVFSLLVTWYIQPDWAAGDNNGPLYPTIFDLRGIAIVVWMLAAFAIGALAGVVIRRVIPAMFATLAAWAGLAYVTGAFLRQHYLPPLTTTNPNVQAQAWVLSQIWTRSGKPASLSMLNQTLHAIDVQATTPQLFEPGPTTPPGTDPVRYLMQHGYTLLTTYQPAGRFWTFQWIEGGWLLALCLLLLGVTVWLVRRRAA